MFFLSSLEIVGTAEIPLLSILLVGWDENGDSAKRNHQPLTVAGTLLVTWVGGAVWYGGGKEVGSFPFLSMIFHWDGAVWRWQ